jgi:hypothetical protein
MSKLKHNVGSKFANEKPSLAVTSTYLLIVYLRSNLRMGQLINSTNVHFFNSRLIRIRN